MSYHHDIERAFWSITIVKIFGCAGARWQILPAGSSGYPSLYLGDRTGICGNSSPLIRRQILYDDVLFAILNSAVRPRFDVFDERGFASFPILAVNPAIRARVMIWVLHREEADSVEACSGNFLFPNVARFRE